MNAIKDLGRLAGFLYVLIEIFGLLNTGYVPAASTQAATVWSAIGPVFAVVVDRVELVGGMWILLVAWGALLAQRRPRALNYLGVVVGAAGIVSVVPALEVLGTGFRLGEMVWVVWLGTVMFRGSQSAAATRLRAFFSQGLSCRSRFFGKGG